MSLENHVYKKIIDALKLWSWTFLVIGMTVLQHLSTKCKHTYSCSHSGAILKMTACLSKIGRTASAKHARTMCAASALAMLCSTMACNDFAGAASVGQPHSAVFAKHRGLSIAY